VSDEPVTTDADERFIVLSLALAEAATRFVFAHSDFRHNPCPTTSALILAVDRYVDACEDEGDHHYDHHHGGGTDEA